MHIVRRLTMGLGLAMALGAAPALAQARKPVIALSMPQIQGVYWVSMNYGVIDEARARNIDVLVANAGGFDKVSVQIQQIENLIQKKPDVLIVGATNAEGLRGVLEGAMAKGIPVVGLGSLPEPKDKLASMIIADHYALGKLQAECLAKELGGKGKIGVMEGPPGVSWTGDRVRGFEETMAKIAPDVKTVVRKATVLGRGEGLQLMEDWLQAYPDIAGVFTAVDEMGAGAVDALIKVRAEGRIKVSSSNLSPIGERYLRKGFIQCESIQQIVLQGREGGRQAIAIIDGKTPKKVVATPAILITKDNIDKVDYTDIKAPASYRPR